MYLWVTLLVPSYTCYYNISCDVSDLHMKVKEEVKVLKGGGETRGEHDHPTHAHREGEERGQRGARHQTTTSPPPPSSHGNGSHRSVTSGRVISEMKKTYQILSIHWDGFFRSDWVFSCLVVYKSYNQTGLCPEVDAGGGVRLLEVDAGGGGGGGGGGGYGQI